MTNKLNVIKEIVETIFSNSTELKYWEHTKRVYEYAIQIGMKENVNMDILLPAVLLHDIGMTIDASFKGHVIKSKLLAKGILTCVGYNENEVEFIIRVIGSHHPTPGAMLETSEEKILYDADNMDIIGVFGVLRWLGSFPNTTKELESSIDLFLNTCNQCMDVRGSLFYTDTARIIGDKTVHSTVEYYNKLKDQIKLFEDKNGFSFVVSF